MQNYTGDKSLSPSALYRVIDANSNRLREGVRVLEDIARFVLNQKELAKSLKLLRHKSILDNAFTQKSLLESRDSTNDVLKPTLECETTREDLKSLIISNFKRTQESARVLEETFKILSPKQTALLESEKFKGIRYTLYTLEKEFLPLLDD